MNQTERIANYYFNEGLEQAALKAEQYANIMNESECNYPGGIELRKEKKDVCRTIAKAVRGLKK